MRWTAQLEFKPKSFRKSGHVTWTEWNQLERVDGPPWVADPAKRATMTPVAYYRKMIAARRGVSAEEVSFEEVQQFDTVANRIRWHFKEMMGAEGEFERRRAELTFLKRMRGRREATAEDVVWDTINSVKKDGYMREYLELGQLAYVRGSCLYVHGGVIGGGCKAGEHAVGLVPGRSGRIENVHDWVAALNDFKEAQLEDWIRNPSWSGTPQGEAPLNPSLPPCSGWKTRDGFVLRGGGQPLQDYGSPDVGP
eukprot:3843424-Prymnesium_polylepis.2